MPGSRRHPSRQPHSVTRKIPLAARRRSLVTLPCRLGLRLDSSAHQSRGLGGRDHCPTCTFAAWRIAPRGTFPASQYRAKRATSDPAVLASGGLAWATAQGTAGQKRMTGDKAGSRPIATRANPPTEATALNQPTQSRDAASAGTIHAYIYAPFLSTFGVAGDPEQPARASMLAKTRARADRGILIMSPPLYRYRATATKP